MVSAALIALFGLTALCLIETAVGVYILRAESARGAADIDVLLTMVLIDLVFNLVLAVGFLPAAVLTMRARPAGRVLALVFGGLFLVARCGCGGFSGIMSGLYASGNPDFQADDFAFSPNLWFVIVAIEVISMVVIVLALSLLMSRPARDYFRTRGRRMAPPVTPAPGRPR